MGSSGKFILNLSNKFFLSFINFGSMAAWKVFTFLEIITSFLSTISLLIRENCEVCFFSNYKSFLLRDIWEILIEKIKIKEKKKNNI